MSNSNDALAASCCLSSLLPLIRAVVGYFSFAYCLFHLFGKTIPWYGDAIAGFFFPKWTLILMVVVWILRLCGVHTPIW